MTAWIVAAVLLTLSVALACRTDHAHRQGVIEGYDLACRLKLKLPLENHPDPVEVLRWVKMMETPEPCKPDMRPQWRRALEKARRDARVFDEFGQLRDGHGNAVERGPVDDFAAWFRERWWV